MNIYLFLSTLHKPALAPTEVSLIFAFGSQQDQFIPGQEVLHSLLQIPPVLKVCQGQKSKKTNSVAVLSARFYNLIDQPQNHGVI